MLDYLYHTGHVFDIKVKPHGKMRWSGSGAAIPDKGVYMYSFCTNVSNATHSPVIKAYTRMTYIDS
jgi:hypothetical protein